MTKYYNFKEKINKQEIKQCAEYIRNGELVIFPTETVYGIGANAFNEEAVKNIFIAKGRAGDNPLIVHICNKEQIKQIAYIENEIEQKLIDSFMPGPFTLILKKKDIIPNVVSAGLDTVGIRMPKFEIARLLIEESNVPIAAPSANVSGRPSGTNIEDIKEELDEKVSAIIDAGNSEVGLESTVVKVINEIPTILRPGKVTLEDIIKVVGKATVSPKVMEKVEQGQKVECPGMKYRHYAPRTKCILVCGENQVEKINEIAKKQKTIVLGFEEDKDKIKSEYFISLGSIESLEEISKNIFTSLRKADKLNLNLIVIEGVKAEGLGLAIMNRLIRTCEYNVI